MTRRTIGLIVTLGLGLLVASFASDARQLGKVYRIGILSLLPLRPEIDCQADEVIR